MHRPQIEEEEKESSMVKWFFLPSLQVEENDDYHYDDSAVLHLACRSQTISRLEEHPSPLCPHVVVIVHIHLIFFIILKNDFFLKGSRITKVELSNFEAAHAKERTFSSVVAKLLDLGSLITIFPNNGRTI